MVKNWKVNQSYDYMMKITCVHGIKQKNGKHLSNPNASRISSEPEGALLALFAQGTLQIYHPCGGVLQKSTMKEKQRVGPKAHHSSFDDD